jgi:parallel beta-helix repeat protein
MTAAVVVAMIPGLAALVSCGVAHEPSPAVAVARLDTAVRVVEVSTAAALMTALNTALPGDDIVVAPGTYTGSASQSGNSVAYFFSGVDGTADHPITVESADVANQAILQGTTTTSNYVLYITGDHWNIKNLRITTGKKGIMLDSASNAQITGCEVSNIAEEGVHFRDGSSNGLLESCNIHDTGVETPGFGEGVYVGSDMKKWLSNGGDFNPATDHITIRGCTIGPNVAAESVDIKEGSTATIVEGCTLLGTGISGANAADSFIDVKGNSDIIRDNTANRQGNTIIVDAFQIHQIVTGWGQAAVFTGNAVDFDTNTTGFVVNASTGTTATASANTRTPAGALYKGNVTTP